MAITAEARSEIITLVVGMFGAAPGAAVLTELAAQYEAGESITQIANNLAQTSVFTGLYPTFLTNEEFSELFVGNLFAETDSAVQAELVDIAVSLLNAGTSRGELIVLAINALDGVPAEDAVYGDSALALDNKVEAATHYTVNAKLSGSSLEDLQDVVSGVTSSAATLQASKDATDVIANAGTSFDLTTTSEVITGSSKNDTITGTYGNDAAVGHGATTYGVGDVIDGKGGEDTLNLTVQNNNDPAAAVTVRNVENINVTDAVGTTLDANNFEGGAVNFALSGAVTATITNADDVDAISATGTGDLVVTDADSAATIDQNGTGDLTVTGASASTVFGMGGTGNLVVDFDSTVGTTTAQLSLSGAAGDLDVADGDGIEAVTIATTGTNTVSLTAGTNATDVTITGDGANTFDLTAGDSVAAILNLDASTSTGTNTFTLGDTLQTTDTIAGGTGMDTLSANFTGATLVKPTLTGIETLKADFDGAAIIDLENATGLTALALEDGTANATFTDVASTVTSLTATTATGSNDISLTYTDASAALLTTTLGATPATSYDDITLVNTSGFILNTTDAGGVAVTNDITLNGDQSEITVNADADLDVSGSLVIEDGNVGDITLTTTADLHIEVDVEGEMGAIAITAADDTSSTIDIDAADATGGDVNISLGEEADLRTTIEASAGDFGDVTIDVAFSGDLGATLEATEGSIGDVTVTGDNAEIDLSIDANLGNVGDVSFSNTGEGASGNFEIDVSGGSIGNITISLDDGAELVFSAGTQSNYDEDEVGTEGNIGDIAITLGDDATLISGGIFANGDIGDVTLDFNGEDASGSLSLGASWVSGDTDDDKAADDYVRGGNIGDITVNLAGDDSNIDFDATATGGNIGAIALNLAGDNVSGSFQFDASTEGTGGTGGSIGASTITLADEAEIELAYTAEDTTSLVTITAGDDVSAGIDFGAQDGDADGVTVTAGDSFDFNLTVEDLGGDFGDINITAGDDFSASGASGLVFISGEGDVGNITLTVGDDAGIGLQIHGYSGDTTFGVFSVTAEDNADIVVSGNAGANFDGFDFTLGVSGIVDLVLNSGGDIGDININAGDGFSGDFEFTGTGGDVGDISVELGADSSIHFDYTSASGDSFGDVTFIGGDSSSEARLDLNSGNSFESIGTIDASAWDGDINIDLAGVATGTTITTGAGDAVIEGTAEQDNIFLGAGDDTVVLNGGVNGDTADTLFSFKAGAGNDLLNVDNANNYTAYAADPGATVLASGDLTVLTDIAGGDDITTEVGLRAALNGGEYDGLAATAGAGTYTFVTAASAAANTFFVFNAVETADADFDSVTLVGVVNSSTTFADLVAANFA